MGLTTELAPHRPAFTIESASGQRTDGILDEEGLTLGCYLHGLFHNDAVRNAILAAAARTRGVRVPDAAVARRPDDAYDDLAALVRERLDLPAIRHWIGIPAASA